jgi:hypothetical protein
MTRQSVCWNKNNVRNYVEQGNVRNVPQDNSASVRAWCVRHSVMQTAVV